MVEYVAVPKNLLEATISGSGAAGRTLRKNHTLPVHGALCPECGRTQCSEYREGNPCPTPSCNGELVEIGERIDPR